MKELSDDNRLIKAARRTFVIAITAAACAAAFVPASLRAQSQPRKSLKGHVPNVTARLQAIQSLPATQSLDLSIGLPLRNPDALASLLQDLYNPSSPNFRHYLTPEEFTARFGPTEQDYAAVIAFARANGFTVSETHSNRVLLNVKASAGAVEKAFGVHMKVYQHPNEKRTFYAPDSDPSVPAALPVEDISGLNDFSQPKPMSHSRLLQTTTNSISGSGTGPGGNYIGYDFRNAYGPDIELAGVGQKLALVQFDGYFSSDISQYAQLAGLPGVPLLNITVDGFNGQPATFNGNLEVSLDIEMAISMAPKLDGIIVYEGPPTSTTINNVLSRIVSDNAARQISCSWGFSGGPNSTTDNLLLQMAAQGQSFFTASGDSDAYYPNGAMDSPTNFAVPASSPYATTVGGTVLLTSQSGSYSSETVWNEGSSNPLNDGIGSSGGVSTHYTLPPYQAGINMSSNGGSFVYRNIPDVALTASDVFVVATGGGQWTVFGTSCAAPLWGAFMALANQQAGLLGGGPLGFANPSLYNIGKGANYLLGYHDITVGSNAWSRSPSNFIARTGYDLCTGFGSPNGQGMLNGLSGGTYRSGFMQVFITPPSGAAIIASSNQIITATVVDTSGVTNATVTANIQGVGNIPLRNTGSYIYSGSFPAPATLGPLPITVIATGVAGELPATNAIQYTVIAPPLNDNFANATKVPVTGASYLSNNRFATTEPLEPSHGNLLNSGKSLWWNFVPATNGTVYVDATGSAIPVVVAVYTGNNVARTSLTTIAATNNLGVRGHVFLTFSAVAGTTYHIAVASAVVGNDGSIVLNIKPGGQPDTIVPSLQVTSPLSGLWVSNKSITIIGTANDPSPNASGVRAISVLLNNQFPFTATGTSNWTSLVGLQPGLNTIQVNAIDVQSNVSATVTLQLTYVVANPVNDLFANATPITLTNNAAAVSAFTTNATREYGEPYILGNPGGHSVWWSFLPPADGVLTLSTSNSTFDTILGIYTGTNVSGLTAIAQNDDAYAGVPGGFSYLNQAVRANQTCYITVDGYSSTFGTARLSCSFAPSSLFTLTTTNVTGGSVLVTTTNLLGGVATLIGNPGLFANNTTVALTAQPSTYYVFNGWTGTVTSTNNPLSITMTGDVTETPSFASFPFTEGFESGNLLHLPWVTQGDAVWFVQTNVVAFGQFSASSGHIGDNQSTTLLLTTNFTTGTVVFDLKVSSEELFDVVTFSIDNIPVQEWSGEQDWTTYSYPITNGVHTLQWTYSKDPTLSAGLDAAFLDDLILPIVAASTNAPSPGRLSLQRQPNGTFVVNLAGQANQLYIIQASTNLVDWVNLSTNIAVGGLISVPDSASQSNGVRFYRSVLLP